MKWQFVQQLPCHVEAEVTQRDQFSNDEVEISETIVREAVQNSLDAALDDSGPVRVTFRWLDASSGLDSDFLESLFVDQIDHAREAGLDVDAIDFENPRALVIEDFGTCGLTGAVNRIDEDNFSDFWRRHGKSHKTGKSRGRWGLGKLVYSTSSELGAFFGATLREGDPDVHVMGQTVLNLREFDGRKYPPHAFFGDVEGEGSIETSITVPLKDKLLLNEFQEQFSLKRTAGSGLSVVVPFPNRDFSVDAMIGVAIVNYFYPLLTRQLVLTFNDTTIDHLNVRELAHEFASDKFQDIDALFDFIESANRSRTEDMLTLKASWAEDKKLDADDFDQEDLERIKEEFALGHLIGLTLPISLKSKDGAVRSTSFNVFIQRPENISEGIDLYVRGGLTVPGEAKFKGRKAFGAMIAEEYEICSFLGDAENAAHTRWIANAEKLKRNYRNPQDRLKVIRNSVLDLYDLLAEEVEEVDEQALIDFFSFEDPDPSRGERGKRKTPALPRDPIPARPRHFILSAVAGGFSVKVNATADPADFPREVYLEIAYDVTSGNPFKKYSEHDFRLDRKDGVQLALTKDAGSVIERTGNTLKLRVEKSHFQLQVTGFDPKRDVKVKLASREA